jgi:hypothetical protein
VFDIFDIASNKVIHCDNVEAFRDEFIAQMRAEKTSGPGNQNAFSHCVLF